MITIFLKDKRHWNNKKIMFFHNESITLEIYTFVEKHKNVVRIDGYNICYYDRKKFLNDYKFLKKGKTMQFYLDRQDGTSKRLTEEEVREHMSEYQIGEAIAAKLVDPAEKVSYMTVGGFIRIELE